MQLKLDRSLVGGGRWGGREGQFDFIANSLRVHFDCTSNSLRFHIELTSIMAFMAFMGFAFFSRGPPNMMAKHAFGGGGVGGLAIDFQ